MIRNIHHVGIVVRNFDAMLQFYRDAFGFETLGTELDISDAKAREISGLDRPRPSRRIAMMKAGNCYLEIMGNTDAVAPAHEAQTTGYVQLCVDVDDIDAEYARLAALGLAFGSAAPVDFGHVRAVTGRDPEGNVIELVQTMRDWDCNLAKMLAEETVG